MAAMTTSNSSPKTFYTSEEISSLKQPPRHVAIIMDGNRRWATSRGMLPAMGHWEGAEILTEIVRASAELGIQTLTVYAFSTENWNRPDGEIETLMHIFEVYLYRQRDLMIREGIKLEAIGDLKMLPERVQEAFSIICKATEHCQRINLILAVNYGGRDEIRRAVSKILELHNRQKISPSQVTEELIASHLDTARFQDPDLLIRTSGEFRVSNFLLWQISYAEIYTTEVLWPDFSPKHLYDAVLDYQGRMRRKGG